MQVTFDLFGSSPIHRALKDVYRLNGETEEDLELIRTEQKFSTKFIVDKIFQNGVNYVKEHRSENEQHLIRELLPELLDCQDQPYPYD